MATNQLTLRAAKGSGLTNPEIDANFLLLLRRIGSVFSVDEFGAKGDGVTDDTAAWQAAIDAASVKGGTVVFDDKTYLIAGPLRDTANSNAQLLLPKVSNVSEGISICFLGVTPPLTTWGNRSGGIIQSTLTSGNGNVFGVKNEAGGANVSRIAVYFENGTLRLPDNPSNTGVNAFYTTYLQTRNFRVDTVTAARTGVTYPYWDVVQPTNTGQYGIIGPKNDAPIRNTYDNTVVIGCYTGVKLGELWYAPNISVCACQVAYEIPEHRHPGMGVYMGAYNCRTMIRATGKAEFNIQLLDVEHNTATAPAGSGASWVEPVLNDIDDPNNYLTGRLVYHMHDDVNKAWTVNGAQGLTIQRLQDPIGTVIGSNKFYQEVALDNPIYYNRMVGTTKTLAPTQGQGNIVLSDSGTVQNSGVTATPNDATSNSVQFSGGNATLSIDLSPFDDVMVMAWVKPTTTQQPQAYLWQLTSSWASTPGAFSYAPNAFVQSIGGFAYGGLYNSGGDISFQQPFPAALVAGQWNLVAVRYGIGGIKGYYVNGNPVAFTAPGNGATGKFANATLFLANLTGGSTPLNCNMQDLVVFAGSAIPSASRIAKYYAVRNN